MSARSVYGAVLFLLLALNSVSGVIKVVAFSHRFQGERALASADLDIALSRFRSTLRWQPGDAPTHVLIGRVIHQAQANGLSLEALAGHQPEEILGVAVAAVARGIALSPADAWAWFNLVDVYQGFRSARVRYILMRRAGEAAGKGAAAPPPPTRRDTVTAKLDPEDRISIATALKALQLEPDSHFYHDFLAKLYWNRGLAAEAAREIRESLELWPRFEAHPLLDDSEFLAAHGTPILEGVERSASNPFVGPVMAARARAAILERMGRIEEAIAAYAELRSVGDESIAAECDLSLGKLELGRGRPRESLRYLSRAVEADPESTSGVWALYHMGLAHSSLSEHPMAVTYLRRHLASAPDSLGGYLQLAEELEKIDESAEAERVYVSAVRKFPGSSVTYARTIDHMRKHGKAKQALSYAEALRKIGPDPEGTERLIQELEREAGQKLP